MKLCSFDACSDEIDQAVPLERGNERARKDHHILLDGHGRNDKDAILMDLPLTKPQAPSPFTLGKYLPKMHP
jgi:hypothetical protein